MSKVNPKEAAAMRAELPNSVSIPDYSNPDWLLTPKETVEYLAWRYGIVIAISSFYSMINRKEGPKPTYFRNRPKFRTPDIHEWVRDNLSDGRKNGRA